MKPVSSIRELENLARENEDYKKALLDTAENLGRHCETIESAVDWLKTNAMEISYETSEDGEEDVIEEVNHWIKLTEADKKPKTKKTRRLKNNNKVPYYTLVCRHEIDGIWYVEFGDWERETVEVELQMLRDDGVQKKNLKIIKTMARDDHGFEVGEAVRILNEKE